MINVGYTNRKKKLSINLKILKLNIIVNNFKIDWAKKISAIRLIFSINEKFVSKFFFNNYYNTTSGHNISS